MPAPRLIIFDCDGTLVDSQHIIVAAMEAAFDRHALPPPARPDVLSIVGLSLVEAVARLTPPTLPRNRVEAIAETYKEAFGTLRRLETHREPLYPGLADLITELAATEGTRLGIATGKSRRGVAYVFDLHGLHPHFMTVQTADTHPSKPHPSMILTAMAEAGTGPAETIMIGDTTFDIEMGRNAGVGTIGVAWGYHDETALHRAGAHAVAADAAALRTAIARLTAGDLK